MSAIHPRPREKHSALLFPAPLLRKRLEQERKAHSMRDRYETEMTRLESQQDVVAMDDPTARISSARYSL